MKRHALASLAALLFSAFASVASAQSAAPQRVVDGFSGVILICNPAVAQAWGIPICEVTAQEFTARAKAGNMRHLVGKPGAVDSMPEHATPKGPIETAKSLRLLIWFDRLDRPEKGWQMNLRAYSELRGPGGQRMWRNVFVQSAIFEAGREERQAREAMPLVIRGFMDLMSKPQS
ncbi:MAG: hypothetical protein MUF11_02125 [Beijerinckiaceae bacterium]|nr:hypothetical protein [Beijerinckiaceae bacterium]